MREINDLSQNADTKNGHAEPPRQRSGTPAAAAVVGVLAVLGTLGAATMTLAHLALPLFSRLGPGRSLPVVAAGFAVGTVLYGALAVGAFRRASWSWPLGLLVNGLALLATLGPPRRPGLLEPVAIVVSIVAVVVLLSPAGRAALRRSR